MERRISFTYREGQKLESRDASLKVRDASLKLRGESHLLIGIAEIRE